MALKCFTKSTTVIAGNQTVTQNSLLQFDYATKECDAIVLRNNAITFSGTGTYLVVFNASGAGTVAESTATLQLYNNGVPMTGISASVNTPANTNISGMGFSTVINVSPSCPAADNTARLTVVNTGSSALISNAVISVVKI